MEQPALRIRLPKRPLVVAITVFLALLLAGPALAEYLGPDRVTVEFKEVRDPDHDVWTMTRGPDVCLIIHTCEEHPSVERQQALCGWVADNSGCDRAYKIKEVTVVLPEATIGSDLQGCTLVDGWCTDTPTLHLVGTEPVASETITLIEGTRNGEPFACPGAVCDVPLVQGGNQFTFWALSSWGDSSQMGTLSAQVDSKGPTVKIPNSWYIWEPLAIQVDDAQHGIDKVTLDIDGGEYGDRRYSWAGSVVPDDFIWDRRFGEIIAPIGDYPVTVRARDGLGNISTAMGEIVIPDPGPADEDPSESAPSLSTGEGSDFTEDYAWLVDPYPAPSSGTGGSADEPGLDTAGTEDAEPPSGGLASGGGIAEPDGALITAPPSSTEGGRTGLLWGAAALAAAASATAYGLSRRKARLDYIREMRERAAEMSSPEASQARLTSLWNAAQARVAPIRAAIASAAASSRAAAASAVAAAAAAAAEARRRIDEALRQRAQQLRLVREGRLEQAERKAREADSRAMVAASQPGDRARRLAAHRGSEVAHPPEPTPGPTATATPEPDGATPMPATTLDRTLTPELRPAPHPPGFVPTQSGLQDLAVVAQGIDSSWPGRIIRSSRSLWNAWRARLVRYRPLQSGRLSVSAPTLAQGTRRSFLERFGFRGTTYNPSTIGRISAGQLVRGAVNKVTLGLGLITSVATNLWDFGVGDQRAKGIGSPEFWASTGVDFGLTAVTGLAAAGLVAGGIAIFTAAGVTAIATAPLAAVLAVTAIVGVAISFGLDSIGAADWLKQRVVPGIGAWGGIAQNARTISSALPGYVNDTILQPAAEVVEEKVVQPIIQSAQAVSRAVTNAAQAVSDFVGNLFGGDK